MIRDWDFVTIGDYNADMADLSSRATGAIKHLKDEIRMRDTLIAALIQSVGGSIKVDKRYLDPLRKRELTVSDDLASGTMVYSVTDGASS